jgi:hypothetical protein
MTLHLVKFEKKILIFEVHFLFLLAYYRVTSNTVFVIFQFQVRQHRDFLSLLPEKVVLRILHFLDPKELCKCSEVMCSLNFDENVSLS